MPTLPLPKAALSLVETFQAGILVIDRQHKVHLVNTIAGRMIGKDLKNSASETCYHLLLGRETPCQDCPLLQSEGGCDYHRSLTIAKEGGGNVYLREMVVRWEDFSVITLHDVTREVGFLWEVELLRKELDAKNSLVSRRQKESLEEKRFFELIFNHLPDAVLTVDSEYVIMRKNKAFSQILPSGRVEKCFEIFGRDEPCESCPAGRNFVMASGQKKSHSVSQRHFTESILPSPTGSGGVLIFRETTRQVQLVEQVRQQQQSGMEKNRILSGLTEIEVFFKKESDPQSMIKFFLDLFLSIVGSDSAAVLIDDPRPGNIWLTVWKNLENDQVNALVWAYLSRDIQTHQTDKLPEQFLPWEKGGQIPLAGCDGRRIGMLVFKGDLPSQDYGPVTLLADSLGSWIHNRLLIRQLEEKANTDFMTGLFNRGYLENAIAEERVKFEKYKVPYSVVVADINRLKDVNEVYGQKAGDQLLIAVGKILKDAVRTTDVAARTGGDEFVLLLTGTDHQGAHIVLKRLEKAFADVLIRVGANTSVPVSVGMGAAGADVFPPDDLIKRASGFMREAKQNQRRGQYRKP